FRAQAACAVNIEGAFYDLHSLHFGEVHVLRGGVHVPGACAVDARAINQKTHVVLLKAADHHVVGNAAFADFKDAVHGGERFANVLCGAFAHFAHVQLVLEGHALGLHVDLFRCGGNLQTHGPVHDGGPGKIELGVRGGKTRSGDADLQGTGGSLLMLDLQHVRAFFVRLARGNDPPGGLDLDYRARNDRSGWIRYDTTNLFRARGAVENEKTQCKHDYTKNITSHLFSSTEHEGCTKWDTEKREETHSLRGGRSSSGKGRRAALQVASDLGKKCIDTCLKTRRRIRNALARENRGAMHEQHAGNKRHQQTRAIRTRRRYVADNGFRRGAKDGLPERGRHGAMVLSVVAAASRQCGL